MLGFVSRIKWLLSGLGSQFLLVFVFLGGFVF